MPEAHIATIKGGSYGLRDFRDGRPGVWFSVHWGPDGSTCGYGSLIAIECDNVEDFMVRNDISDISKIDGKKCIIVDDDGCIRFISMFKGRKECVS